MNEKTLKMMNEMVYFARQGETIIPAFWQPRQGRSGTPGAAIRAALARNLLVQDGVDGMGSPKYVAAIPAMTHSGTGTMQ